MFCPECGAEYREGFTECSDCQVPLVRELPPSPEPKPDLKLFTVLETVDRNLLMVAKSVLEDAGIEYLVEGEGISDPLGGVTLYGRKRPARLQVSQEEKGTARDLLSRLQEPQD